MTIRSSFDIVATLTARDSFDAYAPGAFTAGAGGNDGNGGEGFALAPGWSVRTGGSTQVAADAQGDGKHLVITPASATTATTRDTRLGTVAATLPS